MTGSTLLRKLQWLGDADMTIEIGAEIRPGLPGLSIPGSPAWMFALNQRQIAYGVKV
jgi:hypothetical protein